MRNDRRAVTPQAIFEQLLKLCRYVDALQQEVAKLSGRIQSKRGEPEPGSRPWIEEIPRYLGFKTPLDKVPATSLGVMTILRQLGKQVGDLERDVGAIRAKLDQISNDSWSRQDLKPYLDRPKP